MNPNWKNNYLRYRSYFLNVAEIYKQRDDLKAYLEIILSLVTISIFAVFALKPTLLTIGKLVKEKAGKQEILAIMDQKLKDLSQAQNLYNQERSKISLLETAIPKNPNVDIFARQVEGLSGKHQVQISNFSLGEALILGQQKSISPKKLAQNESLNQVGKISFTISTTATVNQYSSLFNFLTDLEKLRRPVGIEAIRFSTKKEATEKNLQLILSGSVPYLLNEEETVK